MVHRSPARRSPARYLVPLALVATGLSTYLIIEHAIGSAHPAGATSRSGGLRAGVRSRHSGQTTTSPAPAGTASTTTTAAPTVYIIKPGDTLGAIAGRYGVSIATIESLNPQLNPNALQVGEQVRISK